jgi:hypothetical protein
MRRRPLLAVFVLTMLALTTAGCQTGKRPTFAEDPFPKGAPTGDAAIDAVLAKLDGVGEEPFTATYDVVTKFGNVARTASVSSTAGRRSVTLGNVRFLSSTASTTTCIFEATPQCTAGLEIARVSDTLLTPDFYALDAAKRLRRDALSIVGPTVTRSEVIGNQPATCVDLVVSGGTIIYCVLDSGLLAKIDDADVAVTLTSWVPAVTDGMFSTAAL